MQFNNFLIALYARLSKDRSGLSENVHIQLSEGEEYVEDNDGTVALRFDDNDISASKFSKKPRPAYERLLKAIERGEVEIIVVTEMTRLYRRLEELLDLIKMAERTKLRGIWTTDGIGYDLGTPEGIHAAIAAVNNAMLESAKTSKRTKRKKKALVKKGRPMGGPRAYGYEGPRKDDEGNILNRSHVNIRVVEHEAEILKTCVARIIMGERVNTIVRDLNARGIPSPKGALWSNANFRKCITKMR
ncbi:MAG TPA: recombinase family protein, partial [Trebonia sp.]